MATQRKKKKGKVAQSDAKTRSPKSSKYFCWSKKKVSPNARLLVHVASRNSCRNHLAKLRILRFLVPYFDVSCRFRRSRKRAETHYNKTREHMPCGLVVVQVAKKTQKSKFPRYVYLYWSQPEDEGNVTEPKCRSQFNKYMRKNKVRNPPINKVR